MGDPFLDYIKGSEVPNPNYDPNTKKGRMQPPTIHSDEPKKNTWDQIAYETSKTTKDYSHLHPASYYERYHVVADPYSSLEELDRARAENQKWTAQLGHMVGQAVLNEVVLGTIKAIPDIVTGIAHMFGADWAKDFNNPVSEFISNLQDKVRDEWEILQLDPNASFAFGDSGWWFNNGVSVATTASLMLPGLGATKVLGWVAKGLKMTKWTSRPLAQAYANARRILNPVEKGMNDLGKVERATMLRGMAKAENAINYGAEIATSAFVSRVAENVQEAQQTWQEAYNDNINRLKELSPEEREELYANNPSFRGMDDEEIARFVAGVGASETFAQDFWMLGMDVAQFRAITSLWNKMGTRTSTAKLRIHNRNAARKITGLNTELEKEGFWANRREELRYIKQHPFKSLWTGIKAMELSEGVEEGFQGIQQSRGEELAQMLIDPNYTPRSLQSYLEDPSIWEQAFWGVMGGIGFQKAGRGIGNAQNKYKVHKAYKEGKISKEDYVLNLNAEEKRRFNEIDKRASRLSSYISEMQLINDGFDPRNKGVKLDPNNPAHINELKRQITNEFVADMAMDAVDIGNIDLLKEWISNADINKYLLDSGIDTDDVKRLFKQNLEGLVNNVSDMYLNNISLIWDQVKDVDNEYAVLQTARTLTKNTLNRQTLRDKISELDEQIAKNNDKSTQETRDITEKLIGQNITNDKLVTLRESLKKLINLRKQGQISEESFKLSLESLEKELAVHENNTTFNPTDIGKDSILLPEEEEWLSENIKMPIDKFISRLKKLIHRNKKTKEEQRSVDDFAKSLLNRTNKTLTKGRKNLKRYEKERRDNNDSVPPSTIIEWQTQKKQAEEELQLLEAQSPMDGRDIRDIYDEYKYMTDYRIKQKKDKATEDIIQWINEQVEKDPNVNIDQLYSDIVNENNNIPKNLKGAATFLRLGTKDNLAHVISLRASIEKIRERQKELQQKSKSEGINGNKTNKATQQKLENESKKEKKDIATVQELKNRIDTLKARRQELMSKRDDLFIENDVDEDGNPINTLPEDEEIRKQEEDLRNQINNITEEINKLEKQYDELLNKLNPDRDVAEQQGKQEGERSDKTEISSIEDILLGQGGEDAFLSTKGRINGTVYLVLQNNPKLFESLLSVSNPLNSSEFKEILNLICKELGTNSTPELESAVKQTMRALCNTLARIKKEKSTFERMALLLAASLQNDKSLDGININLDENSDYTKLVESFITAFATKINAHQFKSGKYKGKYVIDVKRLIEELLNLKDSNNESIFSDEEITNILLNIVPYIKNAENKQPKFNFRNKRNILSYIYGTSAVQNIREELAENERKKEEFHVKITNQRLTDKNKKALSGLTVDSKVSFKINDNASISLMVTDKNGKQVEVGYIGTVDYIKDKNGNIIGYKLNNTNQIGFHTETTKINGKIKSNFDPLFDIIFKSVNETNYQVGIGKDNSMASIIDIIQYMFIDNENPKNKMLSDEDYQHVYNLFYKHCPEVLKAIKFPDTAAYSGSAGNAKFILEQVSNICLYDGNAQNTKEFRESYENWKEKQYENYEITSNLQNKSDIENTVNVKINKIPFTTIRLNRSLEKFKRKKNGEPEHKKYYVKGQNEYGLRAENNPLVIVTELNNQMVVIDENGRVLDDKSVFQQGTAGLYLGMRSGKPIIMTFNKRNKITESNDEGTKAIANSVQKELTDIFSDYLNGKTTFKQIQKKINTLLNKHNNQLFTGFDISTDSNGNLSISKPGSTKGDRTCIYIEKFNDNNKSQKPVVVCYPDRMNGIMNDNRVYLTSDNIDTLNDAISGIVNNLKFGIVYAACTEKNDTGGKGYKLQNEYIKVHNNGTIEITIDGYKRSFSNFAAFALTIDAFGTNLECNDNPTSTVNKDDILNNFTTISDDSNSIYVDLDFATPDKQVDTTKSTQRSVPEELIFNAKDEEGSTEELLRALGFSEAEIAVLLDPNTGFVLDKFRYSNKGSGGLYQNNTIWFLGSEAAIRKAIGNNGIRRLIFHESLHGKLESAKEKNPLKHKEIVDELMATHAAFVEAVKADLNSKDPNIRKEAQVLYDGFLKPAYLDLETYLKISPSAKKEQEALKNNPEAAKEALRSRFAEEWLVESLTRGRLISYLNSHTWNGDGADISSVQKKSLWQKIIDTLMKLIMGDSYTIKDGTIMARQYMILSENVGEEENSSQSNNINQEEEEEFISDRSGDRDSVIGELDSIVESKIQQYAVNPQMNQEEVRHIADMNAFVNSFPVTDRQLVQSLCNEGILEFSCN